jgi:hypothetical protein
VTYVVDVVEGVHGTLFSPAGHAALDVVKHGGED